METGGGQEFSAKENSAQQTPSELAEHMPDDALGGERKGEGKDGPPATERDPQDLADAADASSRRQDDD
jgi:hypothetical protein